MILVCLVRYLESHFWMGKSKIGSFAFLSSKQHIIVFKFRLSLSIFLFYFSLLLSASSLARTVPAFYSSSPPSPWLLSLCLTSLLVPLSLFSLHSFLFPPGSFLFLVTVILKCTFRFEYLPRVAAEKCSNVIGSAAWVSETPFCARDRGCIRYIVSKTRLICRAGRARNNCCDNLAMLTAKYCRLLDSCNIVSKLQFDST